MLASLGLVGFLSLLGSKGDLIADVSFYAFSAITLGAAVMLVVAVRRGIAWAVETATDQDPWPDPPAWSRPSSPGSGGLSAVVME